MAKMRTVYNCGDCGASHHKWAGKCDSCGAWNSLVEDVEDPNEVTTLAAGMALVPPGEAQPINQLDAAVAKPKPTGISELDRVLDGGFVPGSVTLVGGEPGIGKSTLLLQLLSSWPTKSLYVTAEESAQQVRMRAERLHALRDDLWLLPEASITNIISAIDKVKPELIVIDSIQAVADPLLVLHQVRLCKCAVVHTAWFRKQSDETFPPFWLGTSLKKVALLGRACLNTLSTPCCHLKANVITRCALCVQ
jgi:DNA repair protein RadA/Sms